MRHFEGCRCLQCQGGGSPIRGISINQFTDDLRRTRITTSGAPSYLPPSNAPAYWVEVADQIMTLLGPFRGIQFRDWIADRASERLHIYQTEQGRINLVMRFCQESGVTIR